MTPTTPDRTTWLHCALLLLVAPAACAAEPHPAPGFEQTACWFTIPHGRKATCGRMHVPENRRTENARRISFPVVILRTTEDEPEPDPIVIAGGGGPGASVRLEPSDVAHLWKAYEWIGSDQGRDVILVELRGVGRSEPSLACPDIGEAGLEDATSNLEPERSLALYLKAAGACRDRLTAQGIDVSAYNSRESAADLDDLRRALGYERWNLWGTSYGVRLVLTVLRDFPRGVRSAILDSPVPLEVNEYEESASNSQHALDRLFAGCAADELCAAAFPDLEQTFDALRKQLAAAPITVTVSHPRTLAPTPVVVNEGRLIELVMHGMYSGASIGGLPMMIYALSRGSTDLAAPFARSLLEFYLGIAWSDGLYHSTMCHDEAPFNDFAKALQSARSHPQVAVTEAASLQASQKLCEAWPAGTPEPNETAAVESDVPTLILVGEYDPATPPAWAHLIHQKLPHSHLFEFPGVAHDVFSESGCADVMMIDFLDNPKQAPSASCLEGSAGMHFSVLP